MPIMNPHMSEGLIPWVGTNPGTAGVRRVRSQRRASTIMGLKSYSQVGPQNKVTTVITDTVWSCIISAAADSLRAPTRPVSPFRSPTRPPPRSLELVSANEVSMQGCLLLSVNWWGEHGRLTGWLPRSAFPWEQREEEGAVTRDRRGFVGLDVCMSIIRVAICFWLWEQRGGTNTEQQSGHGEGGTLFTATLIKLVPNKLPGSSAAAAAAVRWSDSFCESACSI